MTRGFQPGTGAADGEAAARHSAVIHDLWGPDIRAIQRIAVVPRILKTACLLTGMGFSTIGRITEESWICCASHDEMGFGMKPGAVLDLDTTICKDICARRQPVSIDEIASDTNFGNHPSAKLFRFQSYISAPIVQQGGAVFGTLCAIDGKPAQVSNPAIIETFRLFADLIASQLDLACMARNASDSDA